MIVTVDEYGNVEGYLTTTNFGKQVGVSSGTVRQWIRRGKLPDSILIGDQHFIKEGTVYPERRTR